MLRNTSQIGNSFFNNLNKWIKKLFYSKKKDIQKLLYKSYCLIIKHQEK